MRQVPDHGRPGKRQGHPGQAAGQGLRSGPHQRGRRLPLARPEPHKLGRASKHRGQRPAGPDEVVQEVVQAPLSSTTGTTASSSTASTKRDPGRVLLESYDIDAVILIEVPEQVVLERILSRRLCLDAASTTTYLPPASGGGHLRRLQVKAGAPGRRHPERYGIVCATTTRRRSRSSISSGGRSHRGRGRHPAPAVIQEEIRKGLGLGPGRPLKAGGCAACSDPGCWTSLLPAGGAPVPEPLVSLGFWGVPMKPGIHLPTPW